MNHVGLSITLYHCVSRNSTNFRGTEYPTCSCSFFSFCPLGFCMERLFCAKTSTQVCNFIESHTSRQVQRSLSATRSRNADRWTMSDWVWHYPWHHWACHMFDMQVWPPVEWCHLITNTIDTQKKYVSAFESVEVNPFSQECFWMFSDKCIVYGGHAAFWHEYIVNGFDRCLRKNVQNEHTRPSYVTMHLVTLLKAEK